MNLLITTQKVDQNDDILGFFHDWILEFSKYYEKITVICLEQGKTDLPNCVNVLSLGKEKGDRESSLLNKIQYLVKFYSFIWRERKNYDTVFVHMNPVYIIFGGIFWRIWHKKIGLWYLHKQTSLILRVAEKITNIVFTASAESFQVKSSKAVIVGHGINTDVFRPTEKPQNTTLKILYVGRISPIKNQQLLLEAVDILVHKKHFSNIEIVLYGSPTVSGDQLYLEALKKFIIQKGIGNFIKFAGSVPNSAMPAEYRGADLTINLCPTGGMDKAVLESLACGVPAIVLNQAFTDIIEPEAILSKPDAAILADKIAVRLQTESSDPNLYFEIIRQKFDLAGLIKKIVLSY
jgi:glycosyltransferase involved in cell wall biosynthesis